VLGEPAAITADASPKVNIAAKICLLNMVSLRVLFIAENSVVENTAPQFRALFFLGFARLLRNS
jgi:hypothetical protein